MFRLPILAVATLALTAAAIASPSGYYRMPALHDETLIFASEGDLFRVDLTGGVARRLTTHPGEETSPFISPDGTTLAFCANYEGTTEVYTMPLDGGVAVRRTWGADRPAVVGFTPDGDVMYRTRHLSTMPEYQLVTIDLATGAQEQIPLNQASSGTYGADGRLYFTRFPFQGSSTKRYTGGTARNIWVYGPDMAEAAPLTDEHMGEDIAPMWWNGRVYFVSERSRCMNLWSMLPDGGDLKQHTQETAFDVKSPALSDGVVVYQVGADLYRYDIAAETTQKIDIELSGDRDQLRERWITSPMSWVTAADISPDGDRVVLTARGEIFVARVKGGRIVHLGRRSDVRYREAKFMPDGEQIIALSDESGELDYWSFRADGYDVPEQLTDDGRVHRTGTVVSPDGRWIAWHDKDLDLRVRDLETKETRTLATTNQETFSDLTFSPDSDWLAYVEIGDNQFRQIKLAELATGAITTVTSDRVISYAPAFASEGDWLYFLSDRHFESLVGSPWGDYAPEAVLVRKTGLFAVDLTGRRPSPFRPDDELDAEAERAKKAEEEAEAEESADDADDADDAGADADTGTDVDTDADTGADTGADTDADTDTGEDADDESPVWQLDGIQQRAIAIPIGTANRSGLMASESALFWLETDVAPGSRPTLKAVAIEGKAKPKVVAVASKVSGVVMSADRKKLLVRSGNTVAVIDAKPAPGDLGKSAVDLGGWSFSLDPREEYRQMFAEAWRLHRDFFYDPEMHGVDWLAMRKKYTPLVDRIGCREELNDLIAQLVGELSALHTYVVRGDKRSGPEKVNQGTLGARLSRDATAGGWRIDTIYAGNADYPEQRSPLGRLDLEIEAGAIITHINGVATISVPDPGVLLRGQAGRPVRLRIIDNGATEPRDVLVTAISTRAERGLRYDHWTEGRRQHVETTGGGDLGYVHVRSMGGGNFVQDFVRNFYPVFNRQGLIVDVRHNTGGNIDSWILEKLMRQAWMYWQGRAGDPAWNMQYAFRGHIVVLCDERTASDGEAFCDGFRRLGLGKVIGTRTWGGEIWLSFSNVLVDRGLASAAEYGVYGPEGEWLIEGHGFVPDIEVDALPHAAYLGVDAPLDAAIAHLQELIKADPRLVPPPPPHPDLSVK